MNFGDTVNALADAAEDAPGEIFPDPVHIRREEQPQTPLDQLAAVAAREPTPAPVTGQALCTP